MRVLFIPCHFDGLPRQSGSARIRCEWVAKYWDGAEVYNGTQRIPRYNLIIFQKVYKGAWARALLHAASKWRDCGWTSLALDLCDPDFIDAEHRRRLMKVIQMFDFAVSPTEPLAQWLARWLPAYVVKDRVDLEEVAGIKKRARWTRRPALVWFGYARNAIALEMVRAEVEELGLPLTIIAETMPEQWKGKAKFIKWDRHTVNREIVKRDIVLNPPADSAVWRYKSDNKTGHAMILGMPVVTRAGQLHCLLSPLKRRRIGRENASRGRRLYDVRESVSEWQSIAQEWSRRE